MAIEPFHFTLTVPANADVLSLVREVTGHMSRYLGLPEEEARQVRDVLHKVVEARLAQLAGSGPLSVTFDRPRPSGPVTVEVVSAAVPGDLRPTDGAPAVVPTRDNGHSRIRLSWQVRDAG